MGGGGSEPSTLYDSLFELQCVICDRFPSLSPIQLRKESFHEVILLVTRLTKHNKQSKQKDSDVIYKPASDNWY